MIDLRNTYDSVMMLNGTYYTVIESSAKSITLESLEEDLNPRVHLTIIKDKSEAYDE